MLIRIVEETADDLAEYEKIPIAFRIETHFVVVPIDNGLGGLNFIEKSVEPYIKNYDAFENELPSAWSKNFDISNWGFFSAYENAKRVGGATVAWNAPEVEMLENRKDLACLWDLRVHSDYRNKGIGRKLFSHAADWARAKNCRQLKIETQNINIPACRFYARQGCKLRGINPSAYGEDLDEIQLLWYLDL